MRPQRFKLRASTRPAPKLPGWPGVTPPRSAPPRPQDETTSNISWCAVDKIIKQKYFKYVSGSHTETGEISELQIRVLAKLLPNCTITININSAPQLQPNCIVYNEFALSDRGLWNLLFQYVLSMGFWPDTDQTFWDKVEKLFHRYNNPSNRNFICFALYDSTLNSPSNVLMSENHKQALELSMLGFCHGSITHLEIQDFRRRWTPKILDSYKVLREFLELVDENFSLIEQEYLMLYSGFSLFATGMRRARDIDLVVCNVDCQDFRSRLYYWVHPLKGKKPTDVCIEGISDKIWTKWTNYRTDLLNRDSINDVILKPGAVFFFKGFKMLGALGCLAEKICRAETTGGYGAYVDVIKLQEFLGLPVAPPDILGSRLVPRSSGMEQERVSPSTFYKSIAFLLSEKYEEARALEEIKSIWHAQRDEAA